MEIASVVIVILALVFVYKMVEFCYAKFPLFYSIFLLALIVINYFITPSMVNDFGTVWGVQFMFAFFYITQVKPSDYDTVESTTRYSSWRDAYVTTHTPRHHHIPGWVRKALFMAIFALVSAFVATGWSVLGMSILQAILPAIRGITAYIYKRKSRP